MTTSESAILDPNILNQLLELDDGNIGLFLEMFELFKEDTAARIQSLDGLLQRGDLEELADVAHAIKGAAGTMGASRLRAAAATVEAAGRHGGPSAALPAQVLRMQEEFAATLQALADFQKSQEG